MENTQLLIMFIVIALILTRGVPFIGKYIRSVDMILKNIGKYFSNLNTMLHEDGHAIFALLFGRGVERIELYTNTEGVADTLTTKGIKGWIPRMLISAAGYPFSSAMAFLFFYFLAEEKYEWLFYGLAAIAVINLLLWIRNLYGVIWLLSIVAILGGIYYLDDPKILQYSMMFVGAILLVESIFSAFEILILSIIKPNDAGDATNLRKSTWLSARIWGLLFFAQSLYFGYLVIRLFI